jgi:ferrous iron transport protein A
MKVMYLTQLGENRIAVVKEIEGGYGVTSRLASLGIRPGKHITKVSSHFWHGPVTVRIGKAQVAIGHGMARKILVEVEDAA